MERMSLPAIILALFLLVCIFISFLFSYLSSKKPNLLMCLQLPLPQQIGAIFFSVSWIMNKNCQMWKSWQNVFCKRDHSPLFIHSWARREIRNWERDGLRVTRVNQKCCKHTKFSFSQGPNIKLVFSMFQKACEFFQKLSRQRCCWFYVAILELWESQSLLVRVNHSNQVKDTWHNKCRCGNWKVSF